MLASWCRVPGSKVEMLVGCEDGLHMPWPQSACRLLLQGELYVSRDGDGCCVCSCCCAKEFLIPKELPIVLTMTRVQNSIAKKLPIFFFLVFVTIFVVFALNILVRLIIFLIYMCPEEFNRIKA